MRIIAGKFKGKKLLEFKGNDVRPTSDMARESLFNILNFRVEDSSFLDLFCGTGAVGIEAISRGARKVYFVDESRESISIAMRNLESIKSQGHLETKNALTFLKGTRENFDIIFMDPPYKFDKIEEILNEIFNKQILNENGIIIYEHRDKDLFSTETFEIYDSRRYGIARFEFMRKRG